MRPPSRMTAPVSRKSWASAVQARQAVENREHPPRMVKRLRTRRWPRQYSTPSWPAAYNLACVYAAICADHNHQLKACMRKTEDDQARTRPSRSRRVAVPRQEGGHQPGVRYHNPECEMERPSEWIAHDPDFDCLRSGDQFSEFTRLPERPDAARLSTIHDSAWSRGRRGLATEQPGQHANRRHRTSGMMLGGSSSSPRPRRPRTKPRKRTVAALETSIRRGRTVKVQVVGHPQVLASGLCQACGVTA